MEIKRRIEKVVITNRRFTVREQESGKNMHCPDCRSGMLNAEKTSVLFEIKQREIFRFIEEQIVHFAETEGNGVMVCLSSLAKLLESRAFDRQSEKSTVRDKQPVLESDGSVEEKCSRD